MGALGKAFYEKYGDESLPVITESMSKCGLEAGKLAKSMLKGEGMESVGSLFGMMGQLVMEFEIIKFSDDTFHFKTTQCPVGIEGTSKGLCEALMSSDKTMIGAILGQEVKIEIPKTVATGDEYCEIIFTTK